MNMLESLKFKKILYVEDEFNIRKTVKEFLLLYGMDVYDTDNVEDALRLYKQNKIDIVMTDLNLPNKSGIDFIRVVREQNEAIPVLITTAFSDEKYFIPAIELNVTRYLKKPLTKNNLLPALEKCCSILANTEQSCIDLGEGLVYFTFLKTLKFHDEDEVALNHQEIKLLETLINNQNRVVEYKILQNELGDKDSVSIDTLRTVMRNLRKKTYKKLITNLSGVGYKINLD